MIWNSITCTDDGISEVFQGWRVKDNMFREDSEHLGTTWTWESSNILNPAGLGSEEAISEWTLGRQRLLLQIWAKG